jgi:hypothetical protein
MAATRPMTIRWAGSTFARIPADRLQPSVIGATKRPEHHVVSDFRPGDEAECAT